MDQRPNILIAALTGGALCWLAAIVVGIVWFIYSLIFRGAQFEDLLGFAFLTAAFVIPAIIIGVLLGLAYGVVRRWNSNIFLSLIITIPVTIVFGAVFIGAAILINHACGDPGLYFLLTDGCRS